MLWNNMTDIASFVCIILNKCNIGDSSIAILVNSTYYYHLLYVLYLNHSPPQESLLLILAHRHSHSQQVFTSIPSTLTMSAQLEVLLLHSFANAAWLAGCKTAMMSQPWTGRYFVWCVEVYRKLHGMWWHYSFPERSTMVPIRKLSFSKPEKASSLIRAMLCILLLSVLCCRKCVVIWGVMTLFFPRKIDNGSDSKAFFL